MRKKLAGLFRKLGLKRLADWVQNLGGPEGGGSGPP